MTFENLKKFNPNFKIKSWCYDRLKSTVEVENYKFYNNTIEHENYYVPINKIVGTTHPDYIGEKWVDLIYRMKRFRKHYTAKTFLEFALTDNFTEDDIRFEKYDNYFFTSAGNHRTCQAKFSNLKNINTYVKEYIFDSKMYEAFQFLLSEKLVPVINENREGKYYRFSSWKIYLNSKEYHFQSFSAIEKFIEHYKIYVPNFTNNIVARFSKKEILFSYNEEKDYAHLKHAIILHKLK